MLQMRTLLLISLIALVSLMAGNARAESGTWVGPINGDWSDPANWQDGGGMPLAVAPGDGDTATFSAAAPEVVNLTANVGTTGMGVILDITGTADVQIECDDFDLVLASISMADGITLNIGTAAGTSDVKVVGDFTASGDNSTLVTGASTNFNFVGSFAPSGMNFTWQMDPASSATLGANFQPTNALTLALDMVTIIA